MAGYYRLFYNNYFGSDEDNIVDISLENYIDPFTGTPYTPYYFFLGGGNDLFVGISLQSRTVHGGDGDDRIYSASRAYGEEGNDYIVSNTEAYGGNGNDEIHLFAQSSNYTKPVWGSGGAGDDLIVCHGSTRAGAYLSGGAGNDRLDASFARVATLAGGSGDDFLLGGNGDDELFGNSGADVLIGGNGADYMSGGVGDDVYVYQDQRDSFFREDLRDKINFSHGDKIDLSALADNLHVVDRFNGDPGQIVIDYVSRDKVVIGIDLDGNWTADMGIELIGRAHEFSTADLIL